MSVIVYPQKLGDCVTGNMFGCKYYQKCPSYHPPSEYWRTSKDCPYGKFMAEELLEVFKKAGEQE